ncbi:MAG TPA: prephenate dehydrogenase/arogenate dehydrogenase family protein [Kofleriaceae bacterium]|nr:prephenate dehydrogenase/arogenate dehydrogenase family protein [Kofleriaceae bacterium]
MSSEGDARTKLDPLRQELGQIDREILALVSKRQAVAQKIGQVKRDGGIPTRDYRQERDVVERARAAAVQHGLTPQLGEELILALIRGSLTVQEKDTVAASGEGSGRRALVIGGSGHMGRWFVRYLAAQGFTVESADPTEPPVRHANIAYHRDWKTLALDHELIVIAAPMPATNEILEEMAKQPPKGVVFDVGSLKSPLRKGLTALRAAGAQVTSVHPMFGPDTELLSGRHVIFIDLGAPQATAAARALFEPTMATLVEMDLESHDRLIAYVLGLSHALNIAFFTALAESGEAAPKLAQLSSTTFDAQLGVAAKVAAENPDLYFEIQTLNDYGTESLAALMYAVERLRSVVRAGDIEGFRGLMTRGQKYLTTRQPR